MEESERKAETEMESNKQCQSNSLKGKRHDLHSVASIFFFQFFSTVNLFFHRESVN